MSGTTTEKVSVARRRARLLARHHLACPTESVLDASEAMIALHATDPLTVYLSAWARTGCTTGDVDKAVYEVRRGVRMLGMRRTMWVVPAHLLPVVQAACTDDVAARLRRQLERDLERWADITAAGDWLRDVGDSVLRALIARGSAAAAELSQDEPRLRTQLFPGGTTPRTPRDVSDGEAKISDTQLFPGGTTPRTPRDVSDGKAKISDTQLTREPAKSYVRPQNITSRVLMLLSAEGLIVRGDRRGGWSSGQFTYYPMAAWLGSPAGRVDPGEARAELARRWLRAFGPAPVSDLQWWAGWTGAQAKKALAALDVREVDLDGQPGVLLEGDPVVEAEPEPVAALLPGLDPTPMGWQQREWFLGPHAPLLFDRTGNIGPTVWWEGRVIGAWAQRASGEVVYRLLEDPGSEAVAAVDAVASRLESWLGEARVTPRYRTPLERELSA